MCIAASPRPFSHKEGLWQLPWLDQAIKLLQKHTILWLVLIYLERSVSACTCHWERENLTGIDTFDLVTFLGRGAGWLTAPSPCVLLCIAWPPVGSISLQLGPGAVRKMNGMSSDLCGSLIPFSHDSTDGKVPAINNEQPANTEAIWPLLTEGHLNEAGKILSHLTPLWHVKIKPFRLIVQRGNKYAFLWDI